jgi:phage-related protein
MQMDRLSIKGPADADFVPCDTQFGLYLKWRTLTAPEPKTVYDEIPGMNGTLDSTEEYGEVFYNDRTLALDSKHPSDSWHADFQAFMNAYHGQLVKIAFSNDPDYYWSGRLAVSEYESKDHSLMMSAIVYPYKFKKTLTTVTKTGGGSVTLTNGRMKVVPEITISGPVTLAWDGYTKALSASSYPKTVRVAGLELKQGTTTVTITGSASVTFSYREGSL